MPACALEDVKEIVITRRRRDDPRRSGRQVALRRLSAERFVRDAAERSGCCDSPHRCHVAVRKTVLPQCGVLVREMARDLAESLTIAGI